MEVDRGRPRATGGSAGLVGSTVMGRSLEEKEY